MKIKIYSILLLACINNFAQQTPALKQKGTILILGGIAHLGDGKVIQNSLISLSDGKIVAIGDATVMKTVSHDLTIDASGKHIYPGFIAPNSTLGLVEIDAVRSTDDESEIGEMNPHIRSIIAYNSESKITETARPNGVLIAQIAPRGGRISGRSSVVQLDAWNWEDATVALDNGLHINWPQGFTRSGTWSEPGNIEANKKYEDQINQLQQFFDNSLGYSSALNSKKDLPYLAMESFQNGKNRIFIQVNGEKEMIDAIAFKQKNKILKMTIIGGYYSYKITDLILKNDVSVLLRRVHELPLLEDHDPNQPFKNAKLLSDKGILVGLQNSGEMERMQIRNLPFYAGTCAAWGMEKEEALKLITLNNAKILGISDLYGSLEIGKSATLFISEGDALDMKTNKILHAFIDGRQISLKSHQTELNDRYTQKYLAK